MATEKKMNKTDEILDAYIKTFDWSECDEDPENYFIDNFDPDEFYAFSEDYGKR